MASFLCSVHSLSSDKPCSDPSRVGGRSMANFSPIGSCPMGKSSHLKVGFYLPNFSAWDIWKAFKMNFLDALNWVVGEISPLHSWGNFLPVIILMKKNASVLWLTSYFLPTSINPVVPPVFSPYPGRLPSSSESVKTCISSLAHSTYLRVHSSDLLPGQTPAEQANSITIATCHLPHHHNSCQPVRLCYSFAV